VFDDSGVVLALRGGDEIHARKVVLAPGAWLSGLARQFFGLDLPTTVSAETVSYFAPRRGCGIDHTYKAMPVFLSYIDNALGPYGCYGLPQIDVAGVKVSAHFCGPVVDPDRRPCAAGGVGGILTPEEEAAAASRVAAVVEENRRCISRLLPHLEVLPFESQNCLYTCTPDHDYIIDRVPGHSAAVLAGGGSGHAFKMGPAIGEACARLALDEEPAFPLEQFSIERLAVGRNSASGKARRK